MSESVNVQVLSNALSLFTNAIQAAASSNSSINVDQGHTSQGQTSRQGQTTGSQAGDATSSGSATNV